MTKQKTKHIHHYEELPRIFYRRQSYCAEFVTDSIEVEVSGFNPEQSFYQFKRTIKHLQGIERKANAKNKAHRDTRTVARPD